MDDQDLKYEDEIDLQRVLGLLWVSRRFIVTFVVLVSCFSYFGSLFLEDKFTSRIVVVSTESNDGPAMLAEYSGIASMAGLDLSEPGVNNKELALEVIKSVDFFERLYEEDLFSAQLMAHLKYDPVSKVLNFDQDLYNRQNNTWNLGNNGKTLKPSLIAAYGTFHEDFFKVSDGSQTFIKFAITHNSPYVAEKWVSKIFKEINQILKERDKIEAERSLNFLKDQLSKKNIPVLERTLSYMVQQEMQKLMLAEISEDYVFKIVESPRVPQFPSSPNRNLILILGLLMGTTLSFMIVLILGFYSKNIIKISYLPPSIKLEEQ